MRAALWENLFPLPIHCRMMERMRKSTYEDRQRLLGSDQQQLSGHQCERFNALLQDVLPSNAFYQAKLQRAPASISTLEQLTQFPFTYKQELVEGAADPAFAANLTFPVNRYVRMHRTSGTRGKPMVILDTAADWRWWMEAWSYVLDAAHLTVEDRVVMAFSFGPFVGFWSAFDAVIERGCLVAPAGGMTTLSRIEMIRSMDATTIFCTPSYALHMAEVAANHQINVSNSTVNKIIVAGEPGGSIPAIRQRMELAWNAKIIDHAGASEIGPWGFADQQGRGMYVNEAEYIAEFLSVATGAEAEEGELSELILTCLGRVGSPMIRYRTGDLVRPTWNDPQVGNFVLLDGGVLGRVDDMLIVRGINIYPSSVEQILLSFPEIVEYRMTASKDGEMDVLRIEIEDHLERPLRVQEELRLRLGLRVEVDCVAIGSLPRFEGKGKRFVDSRKNGVTHHGR